MKPSKKELELYGWFAIGISTILAIWFGSVYLSVRSQISEVRKYNFDRQKVLSEAGIQEGDPLAVHNLAYAMTHDEKLRDRMYALRAIGIIMNEEINSRWGSLRKTSPKKYALLHWGSYVSTFRPPEEIGLLSHFWPGIVEILVPLIAGLGNLVRVRAHGTPKNKATEERV